MRITRVILISSFIFLFSFMGYSQTVLIQQNFNAYDGTSLTVPPGWNFSYNGNYTSSAYSGASGPNSYKFGTNGAAITTPLFSNADSLQFWMRGASVDTLSFLTILYTVNTITWDTLAKVIPISNSGTNMNFHVPDTAVQLQFTFTKSVGNLAFDDFLLTRDTILPQIKGGAISNIRVYFNHPVDTTVSVGVNAVFLNGTLTDTLVAYINRAKYSIDVTQYDYTAYPSDKLSAIATAINAAYTRGVKIRWIYNGSSSNHGLTLLDTGIATLASPIGGPYNIMHDKFVVFDAHASDSIIPIVWTGSADWSGEQMDSDYNNIIILQSQKLALAFTAEFNQMWGDTTLLPDTLTSKFGPHKTDLGQHLFNVGGVQVELYFSPSDSTNSHILQSISTANTNLYFGVYTFTETSDAAAIANKYTSGVYSAGIIDQYSIAFSAYPILNTALGNNLKVYADNNTIYHNKYMIVDASDFCSDPQVLTGSHNWSTSADVQNDENTVIVHSDTIANMYYQAFSADFASLGGTLTQITNCNVTTDDKKIKNMSLINIYPNPSSGKFLIDGINTGSIIIIYDGLGNKVESITSTNSSSIQLNLSDHANGIYLIRILSEKGNFIGQKKFVKTGD